MKLSFDYNSRSFLFDLTPMDKSYRAIVGEKTVEVEILQAKDGKLDLLLDGKRLTAYVSSDNAKRWVTVSGQTFVLTKSSGSRQGGHGHQHSAGELTAP